jgi:hypothetical protein
VMATAAGKPARSEGRGFSRATVRIIPGPLLTADPLEAVTELMARPVVREERPQGPVAAAARTEPTFASGLPGPPSPGR